ncbi:hypothetical protein HD554DRAFT_2141845 [Boletus coccyginus]|nr:hypothetical protein HD554DRAFT_2141845 [Boletus coccyginus]
MIWPTLHVQTSISILTLDVLSVLTEICGAHQEDSPETSKILYTVRIGLSLQSKKIDLYPPVSGTICHCLLGTALGGPRTTSSAPFTPADRTSIEMLYKLAPSTLTSVNCTYSNRQHGDDLDGCNKPVVRLVEDRYSQEGCRSRLKCLRKNRRHFWYEQIGQDRWRREISLEERKDLNGLGVHVNIYTVDGLTLVSCPYR